MFPVLLADPETVTYIKLIRRILKGEEIWSLTFTRWEPDAQRNEKIDLHSVIQVSSRIGAQVPPASPLNQKNELLPTDFKPFSITLSLWEQELQRHPKLKIYFSRIIQIFMNIFKNLYVDLRREFRRCYCLFFLVLHLLLFLRQLVVQYCHGFTCLMVLFPWVCLVDFGLVAMKFFFPPFILFKLLWSIHSQN